MRIARRITQILFIMLFFTLFLAAPYVWDTWIPADLFLRMDVLAMLSSGLAGRFIILKCIPAVIILIVTVFMGRFFCGWVCPMGSTLDGFDASVKAKSKNRKNSKLYRYRFIKYFILVIFLVTSLFSMELAGWLSPIPLYTRTVTALIYPVFVFFTFGIFDILYKVPFLADITSNIQDELTKFFLPLSNSPFRGFLLIGIMFIALIGLSFLNRRFWCRNLCPLGALLGFASKFRRYRRRVSDSCTDCGLCHAACRMGAIPENAHQTDHVECINCMDCQAICPAGAISFDFRGKPSPEPVDLSRRRFLGAGLTGFATLGLIGVGFSHPVTKGKVVRPPGALYEPQFLDRCIRCGECIRVCSTSGKGLHFSGLEGGLYSLGSPVLLTPAGYCEYNCRKCGHVCPTGAIHPLTEYEKKDVSLVKMGTAHFDKSRCIPWYYGEDCLVCEENCPLDEKAIKYRKVTVTTINGRTNLVKLPYVDESLCMGCGICTYVCPLSAEKGIFLTNTGEQRWIET